MLFEIQGLVVQGWISSWEAADLSAASQGDDSFREALLVMAGSVVGLARQCSGHGVEFLQHLQQQQLRRQSSRAGRSGEEAGAATAAARFAGRRAGATAQWRAYRSVGC